MFFTVAFCTSILVNGYMRSGENTASIFRVLRCSAVKPWKSNDKRKSNDELRDNTFIAARET